MIHVSIDHFWNNDWQGKTKVLKEKINQVPFAHNLTQVALRMILAIHSTLQIPALVMLWPTLPRLAMV
jgi:hypothetical protein